MRAATILLTALALLACAPQAEAGWQINRATAIAQIVWHHPCVDRMQIRRDSAETALKRGAVATVAAAWADEAQCIMFVSTDWPLTWPEFCTHVLHEAGHLAHYRDPANTRDPDHSLNPASIMYGQENRAYGTIHQRGRAVEAGGDARCSNRGRPYLESHGLLERQDPHP